MKVYLILYNIKEKKRFTKYFDSEYDKDKFKRKLTYSKQLIIIEDSSDIIYV